MNYHLQNTELIVVEWEIFPGVFTLIPAYLGTGFILFMDNQVTCPNKYRYIRIGEMQLKRLVRRHTMSIYDKFGAFVCSLPFVEIECVRRGGSGPIYNYWIELRDMLFASIVDDLYDPSELQHTVHIMRMGSINFFPAPGQRAL